MFQVERNNLELVRFLLEQGAQVNVSDDNGATPITYAVIANNQEMADLLGSYGTSSTLST